MAGRRPVVLSVAARVLMNTEALNMAESVGNVTRRRRAPVAFYPRGEMFSLVYVPAVSGEAVAHHYQHILARIASEMGLSVTKMSLDGYFLKFSDNKVINKYYPEVAEVTKTKDSCKVEKTIISKCVVADIGGFLHTDTTTKRTSRFSVGYLIPTLDALEAGASAAEPQLGVRYSPEAKEKEQALIYVEVASAAYAFMYSLNASDVARCSSCDCDLGDEERLRRVEAAVKALVEMMQSMNFGAKRTRFLPHWKVLSLTAAVSTGTLFQVTPPHDKGYLEDTVRRKKVVERMLGARVELFHYSSEGIEPSSEAQREVKVYESFAEALSEAGSRLLECLQGGC